MTFTTRDNVAIEIKLSRSKIDLKPSRIHADQIRSYMAMKGADNGLLYYYSSNFERISKFEITMSAQGREEWLSELDARSDALLAAVQSQNPSLAPHVAFEADLNFLCRTCYYAEQCGKMRRAES